MLIHCFVATQTNWIKNLMARNDILPWNITQGLTYTLYPLLGLIADVYITRYKILKISFWCVLISSVLMIFNSIQNLVFHSDSVLQKILGA